MATIDLEAAFVEPGTRRVMQAPLRAPLPSGRYPAVPVLDFRGAYVAAARPGVRIP